MYARQSGQTVLRSRDRLKTAEFRAGTPEPRNTHTYNNTDAPSIHRIGDHTWLQSIFAQSCLPTHRRRSDKRVRRVHLPAFTRTDPTYLFLRVVCHLSACMPNSDCSRPCVCVWMSGDSVAKRRTYCDVLI